MIFTPLRLSGVFRVDLQKRSDSRGFFARVFDADEFSKHGLAHNWAQMNCSFTGAAGTIRGLHFQRPPAGEVKVVRCTRGALFDVVVDIREGSPTFGQWESIVLRSEALSMVYIPVGFAHGFQTMEPDTEAFYCHSVAYSAHYEGGVRFDDSELAIKWPLPITEISDRDLSLPRLANIRPIEL